ncbi:MAG: LTA synthase family protein [Candidatus Heteroscillospira sp.]
MKPSARLGGFALLSALTGLGLSAAVWLVTCQSIRGVLAAMAHESLQFFGAALFLALCTAAVGGLGHSLFFGGTATACASMLAAFVNYFKTLITSTPLELQDFALIGKAGDIAGLNAQYLTLSRNSVLAILAVVCWLAVLWFVSGPLRPGMKSGFAIFAWAALCFAFIFQVFADSLIYTPLELPLKTGYSQSYANGKAGFVLGLWRSVIYRDAMDENYTLQEANAVEKRVGELIADIPAGGDREKANVILILSESFFDVTTLPGVSYESDPISEYHALQKEGVSGSFYTRSLGYGTCNIELELLTGINTRLLPSRGALNTWGSAQFEKLPAVPAVLRDAGYYTAFLHMYNDSIYNRSAFLPGLGFEDIFFSEDLAQIDPEAAAAGEGYWDFMEQKISGWFYSDDYMTDVLIDLYEQKKSEGNVFLYGVSMENHSTYSAGKYEEYDHPFTADLDEEADGALNAATQGVANASKALKKLTDYLKTVPEPTVVVFFGDHRPGLGLEGGGNVYSRLGMCEPDSGKWSAGEYKELYRADYLIWSNDEAYLPAEAGSRMDDSSNTLGLAVLNAAGVEKPDYWRLVESMKEDSLIYTPSYYIDSAGAASLELPESRREKYDTFAFVLHDAFNKRYLTDGLT